MMGTYITFDANYFDHGDGPRKSMALVIWAFFKRNDLPHRTPDWPHLTKIVLGDVRVVEGKI